MRPRRWKQNPRIVCQEAGSETLLYDPGDEAVHVLNRTAAAIWQLCDGEHEAKDIAAGLRRAFAGTEAADLRADVARTLAIFQVLGLVEHTTTDSGLSG